MHVYDDRYPVNPAWPVAPPKAPAAAYRLVQRELGLDRAVVVQPNAYVFDNRCTTNAIRELGPDVLIVSGDHSTRAELRPCSQTSRTPN